MFGHPLPVLVPVPLEGPFDYRLETATRPAPGSFIEVPFGSRRLIGVVWDERPARALPMRRKGCDASKPGALPIVKQGGTIVLAASLTEGVGSPEFQHLLADNADLSAFIRRIMGKDYFVMDQWQLEEFVKVAKRCKIKVVTQGLSPETLKKCHVDASPSVEQAVADCLKEYGPNAKIAVIPKGPYVLPYVGS